MNTVIDRTSEELGQAWISRAKSGIFGSSEAVRVFYGPGEGTGPLAGIAIDRFGSHAWITEWEHQAQERVGPADERTLAGIEKFLRSKETQSAVILRRPEKGLPPEPEVLFGQPPQGRFVVREAGAAFRIQLLGTRHPGLFLDHAPLRQWLRHHCRGVSVLNTFAYTGSLSVAAGLGGAAEVVTLDLSRPTVQWAEENWRENALTETGAQFIYGDVFDWLPRFKKENRLFDCVILDPPSFSRGKKGSFSTEKDSGRLHQQAMALLKPGGFLVTSINSAKIPRSRFESDVYGAAQALGLNFQVVLTIDLPETFPTRFGDKDARYLKGLVLRRV